MIDRLAALIVDESKWLTASMGLALLSAGVLLLRQRLGVVPVRCRVLAAMNLFFGVMVGSMAFGHLLAVTVKLSSGTLAGSVPTFYLIGVVLAVPACWVVLHTRSLLRAGGGDGNRTPFLNGWLALTLLALGIHNLPLAAPGLLNIAYHLHTRRAVGRAIVALAIVLNTGLFIASLVLLASGRSFEEFSGMERVGAGREGAAERIRGLLDGGRYAEAEKAARCLLAPEAAEAPATGRHAAALDLLAEAMWRGGKGTDPEALAAAEKALAIRETLYGADHPLVAESLATLAPIVRARDDYVTMRRLHERALAIRERHLGPEHPDTALSLNGVGVALRIEGDYAGARRLYERGLAILEKSRGPEHPQTLMLLANLAEVRLHMGEYEETRPLVERVLAGRVKALGAAHPDVAESWLALGGWFYVAGDYAEARRHGEKGLAIARRAFGSTHPRLAQYLGSLALTLQGLNDHDGAIRLLEEALEIEENRLGRHHTNVASLLQNLGVGYRTKGDLKRAAALTESALAIRREILSPDHTHVSESLYHLALLREATGDRAAARRLVEEAQRINEKRFGIDHPYHAEVLWLLARVAAEGGDARRAGLLCRRVLATAERRLGPRHPQTAEALVQLARHRLAAGERQAALDAALRAERIAREHFRAVARGLSEREALRFESLRAAGLDLAFTVAADGRGGPRPAAEAVRIWDQTIRSRALVLDELASRHRPAAGSGDPAAASLAGELRQSQARLARILVQAHAEGSPDAARARLDAAWEETERAERALAATSASWRRESARGEIGFAEVARALPEGAGLLAYARYRRHRTNDDGSEAAYAALVLRSAGSDPVLVPLGPAEPIDRMASAWREAVATPPSLPTVASAGEAEARRLGSRLRRAVWDPVAPALRGARLLFIVPDGALHLVNFAALPAAGGDAGAPGRYLIEEEPLLHLLSAERDLVREEGPRDRRGPLLALGGADFDGPAAPTGDDSAVAPVAVGRDALVYRGPVTNCESFRALRFPPLPAAETEIEEIAALWESRPAEDGAPPRRALRLTRRRASEEAFKRTAPASRVLHLATHGFVLAEDCAPPGEAPHESPLLLAGLALAGANHREPDGGQDADGASGEDGILTAEEIGALDLRNVEWAVLSACETGVGPIRSGEGVLGLRRAFEVAGAGSLILSLFKVDDATTRAWMKGLYEARLGGADTAGSVRRAGLAVLRARRARGLGTHPFYWSPFVAAGDWR